MPEQAEDGEEEAKAADLDALLELFREPEEPPRRKIPGSVWIFLALVLAMAAIWLAARVATGQLAAKSETVLVKPTKAGNREPREEKAETGSVVDDYLERCKKGMTAREVRWIVEDFQKAGLDEGSVLTQMVEILDTSSSSPSNEMETRLKKLMRDLGDRQRSWYAEALSDALRLDKGQKSQILEQLRLLMKEDFARSQSQHGEGYFEAEALWANWLANDAYAPWELCSLTPEQEAVTSRSEVEDERRERAEEPEEDRVWTSTWLDRGTPFRLRPITTPGIDEPDEGGSALLLSSGSVFPLEEAQIPEGNAVLRMEDLTRLHPAQLKILLLQNPQRVGQIIEALEKAGQ